MKLEFRNLDLRLAHRWKIARTGGTNLVTTVCATLTDASGLTGIGEAAPVERYRESPQSVAAFLGKIDITRLSFSNPADSTSYLESLSKADAAARCAINVALMDGAAKFAGKPLCDHLGLGFREQRHVTSYSIGIDRPEIIQTKAAAAASFPVLKMKVGSPDDKANLHALRQVAPTKPVRVDANEGWTTKEHALEMIEWLAEDGSIEFVEQPMPEKTPVEDWFWLKSRSPLPIFADESYHGSADIDRAAECFHGVNVKLVKAGGVTPAMTALQAARKAGLKTMLGCMIESSVLISAAAHLAELCDYLDLDGNLLITNDPFKGVTAERGVLSFADAPEPGGLRVRARTEPI